MIDAPAAVRTRLLNDPTFAALTTSVYCDTLPTNATAPYVVAATRSVAMAAPPTPAYDRIEVQVDVVADTVTTCDAIASRARTLLQTMRGTVGTAVIPACDVLAAERVDDTTSSPARPRWVIAVELTAKS